MLRLCVFGWEKSKESRLYPHLGSKTGVATAPGAHTLDRSLITVPVLRREQHFREGSKALPSSGSTAVAAVKKLTRRTKDVFKKKNTWRV